jgi:flagellin
MALRINYNFESVFAQRNLTGTQQSFFRVIEQLSSGLRMNKAADDTAGLAVSETHSLLARMRELAVQSSNDTLTNPDRLHIQNEMKQLLAEGDRIAPATQFNTMA